MNGSLTRLAKLHIEASISLKFTDDLNDVGDFNLKELLYVKQVFPYEYLADLGKLNDKDLLPREAFYSFLNGVGISGEKYDSSRRVWKKLDVRN